MSTRDTLHRLLDELPESELAAAERFLHYLRTTADPILRALLEAQPDDERRAMQEARKELARGEVRTLEDVRRELGL
jgi:bacterioferritin (cytochrome b1)